MAYYFSVQACHFKRAASNKVFTVITSYGYCASKEETYYCFKGNLMISSEGIVTEVTLTAVYVDEWACLWDITGNIQELVFADKGLIGSDFQQELKSQEPFNL